jgi:hypothetical protein
MDEWYALYCWVLHFSDSKVVDGAKGNREAGAERGERGGIKSLNRNTTTPWNLPAWNLPGAGFFR